MLDVIVFLLFLPVCPAETVKIGRRELEIILPYFATVRLLSHCWTCEPERANMSLVLGYCPCSKKGKQLTPNKFSVWCLRYSKLNASVSENEMVTLCPVAVSLFSSEPIILMSIVRKELDRMRGRDKVGRCDLHGWVAERERQGPRSTTDETSGNYKKAGATEY